MQTLHKVKAIQCISAPKTIAVLICQDTKREKWLRNHRKTSKTAKNRAEKTGETKKTLSFFGQEEFQKPGEYKGEKGETEIFYKNGWFSAKIGGLESPHFILGTILVITFHKLYQQHSERLSLRSNETKSHRHLNIKEFVFLNPCLTLIDVLIIIIMKWIPQIPVNTCVCYNVAKCTQKSLQGQSPPA